MPEFKVGDIIKCKVTGIEDYGAFVSIGEEYSGLIHISEISEKFVKNVGDYLKVGENIFVEVIEIDEENKKVKLSIKNIDYHNTGKVKNGNGFKILKENLPKWIEEYHKMNG